MIMLSCHILPATFPGIISMSLLLGSRDSLTRNYQ